VPLIEEEPGNTDSFLAAPIAGDEQECEVLPRGRAAAGDDIVAVAGLNQDAVLVEQDVGSIPFPSMTTPNNSCPVAEDISSQKRAIWCHGEGWFGR
jgi:hypothetical protein